MANLKEAKAIMKEFYPVILASLITQAVAELNQSAAASKR